MWLQYQVNPCHLQVGMNNICAIYIIYIDNSIIFELLLLAERSMSYDQDPSFNLMTPTADSNMSLYDEVSNWIQYYVYRCTKVILKCLIG